MTALPPTKGLGRGHGSMYSVVEVNQWGFTGRTSDKAQIGNVPSRESPVLSVTLLLL